MAEQVHLFGLPKNANPNIDIDLKGGDYALFENDLTKKWLVLANPKIIVKDATQFLSSFDFNYKGTFGKLIANSFSIAKWQSSQIYNDKILTLKGLRVLVNRNISLDFELLNDNIEIIWEVHNYIDATSLAKRGEFFIENDTLCLSKNTKKRLHFSISKKGIPINFNLTGLGQVQVKNTDTNTVLSTFSTTGNNTAYVPKGTNVGLEFSVDTTIDSPASAKDSKFFFQRVGDISVDGNLISPTLTGTVANATGNVQVPVTYSHNLVNVQNPIAVNIGFEKTSKKQFLGHYKAQSGTTHLDNYTDYDTTSETLVLDINTTTTVQKINDLTDKGNDLEQLLTGKATQSAFDGAKIDFNGTINQGYEVKKPRVTLNVNIFSFHVYMVNVWNKPTINPLIDIGGGDNHPSGWNGGNELVATRNDIRVAFDNINYGGGLVRNFLSNAITLTNMLSDEKMFETSTIDADGNTHTNSGNTNNLDLLFKIFQPVLGNSRAGAGRGVRPVIADFYETLIIDNLHTADEVSAIMEDLKTAYAI